MLTCGVTCGGVTCGWIVEDVACRSDGYSSMSSVER